MIMKHQHRGARGVSMTETLIALPVIIVFSLCLLQFALIYRAKLTVQYAANEAARAGALNNALPLPFNLSLPLARKGYLEGVIVGNLSSALTHSSVWQGYVRGMMPLYAMTDSVGGMAKAWAKTNKDMIQSGCVEYLNPTQSTFLDWGIIENYGESRGVLRVPNDNLRYRKPLPYEAEAKGSAANTWVDGVGNSPDESLLRGPVSNKTLGEANILHLRVHYGYKLFIPVADKIIIGAMQGYRYAVKSYYSVFDAGSGGGSKENSALDAFFLSEGRFPITEEGVAGMTTSAYWHPFYSFGAKISETRSTLSAFDMGGFGGGGYEQYATVISNVESLIRGGISLGLTSVGGAAVDAVGDAIGLRNAFCPALWANRSDVENVPNPFE